MGRWGVCVARARRLRRAAVWMLWVGLVGWSLLAGLLVGGLLRSQPSAAWRAENLDIIVKNDDAFRNYDYENTDAFADEYNCDWAVTLLFWNDADVQYIDDVFGGWSNPAGGMYGRLKDTGSYETYENDGRKSWGVTTFCHFRQYGAEHGSLDYCYTTGWGFYCIGTTHYDKYEYPPYGWDPNKDWLARWFGWSEDAEHEVIQEWRDRLDDNSMAQSDATNFANNEPYRSAHRWNSTYGVWDYHIWENNKYASKLECPPH